MLCVICFRRERKRDETKKGTKSQSCLQSIMTLIKKPLFWGGGDYETKVNCDWYQQFKIVLVDVVASGFIFGFSRLP